MGDVAWLDLLAQTHFTDPATLLAGAGNLLLTFPGLSPGDFRPWVNEDVARQRDASVPATTLAVAPLPAASSAAAAAPTGSRPLPPPDVRQLFVPPRARAGALTYRPAVLAAAEVRYARARLGVDETRRPGHGAAGRRADGVLARPDRGGGPAARRARIRAGGGRGVRPPARSPS